MRIRLAVMLAALVVTPALAQVLQVQPIQRPIAVQPIQPVVVDNDVAEKVMTLEDAQKRIAKLQSDKRELNLQLSDSTAKLNEALATIDQWTKKGGSLVHAYCESDEVSRNSAGATENCAASGYRCAEVEGTCRKSCNVTTDCAGYHICDTGKHVCVRA
jgi:hypothetical protein